VGLEFPLETQFRWLKTILPKTKTIGVIYNPIENKKRIEDAARIARRLGLNLEAVEVYTAQDIPSALATLSKRADVFWGLADSVVLSPQMAKHILLFAFRNKIPFIGPSDAWVRAGALYALDWDYRDLGFQCGEMALQVLQGKKPKEIPRATPRKVLYSVNLKTAEQIKVTIPEEIANKARDTY
jgi:putative ABC transport system substrate-binding protein